jgi:hypothetical protein
MSTLLGLRRYKNVDTNSVTQQNEKRNSNFSQALGCRCSWSAAQKARAKSFVLKVLKAAIC